MPNTRSAEKRLRQNEKRRLRNRVYRTRARTFVKRTRRLIVEGKLDEAEQTALQACRALDRAASKGVINKNNAARRKSRLMKHLNKAKAQAATV
ncbi:MAG: 30S ribosomal protein S20 [Anaerolineae bacterium]